jgi:hypothetical protein
MRDDRGDDAPSLNDILQDKYPVDGSYCVSDFLTCAANFSQDMATTIDFLFAGLELVLIIDGCAAGPEGCLAGAFLSEGIWNMGPNGLESALSGVSLLLTAYAEYTESGEFGESTQTSFVTFLAGGLAPDPIVDLVIDGYASGYNHGFFNDIFTITNGGDFLKKPFIWK